MPRMFSVTNSTGIVGRCAVLAGPCEGSLSFPTSFHNLPSDRPDPHLPALPVPNQEPVEPGGGARPSKGLLLCPPSLAPDSRHCNSPTGKEEPMVGRPACLEGADAEVVSAFPLRGSWSCVCRVCPRHTHTHPPPLLSSLCSFPSSRSLARSLCSRPPIKKPPSKPTNVLLLESK